jgi:membrane associated rhomboid family serine protease
MERLLARLERRFGRYAIENLTTFIVGGQAIVFLLMMTRPSFVYALMLDPRAVARGEVWRLVTYLFIPTSSSMVWVLFALYWVWLVGTNLEHEWGPFKFNAYYLLGMIGTTAAAFLAGGAQGNTYLNLSLFFAFATLYPDYQILLFLILPVRVKWIAWLSAAVVAFELATGDWPTRGAIVAALANYLLFFAPTIARVARGQRLEMAQSARRASFASSPPPASALARSCAICGARESDGADIRVCSCEKCKAATGGAARSLCLEHARNH